MRKLFVKLNSWIRGFILGNVDKEFDKPFPYHKRFGNKKA